MMGVKLLTKMKENETENEEYDDNWISAFCYSC